MYTEYKYLWPPRPTKSIPKNMIKFYTKRKWVGQCKKNGTCTVLFFTPDGVIAKTRHNADHKAWDPNTSKAIAWLAERIPAWTVLVGELLHSKGPDIKDTFYIFDILVWDGEEVTSDFIHRQKFLQELFTPIDETWSHYILDNNVWLAKTIPSDELDNRLTEIFAEDSQYDEGLVLKNPNSSLELCFRQTSNSKWQVKCRKPSKNYNF